MASQTQSTKTPPAVKIILAVLALLFSVFCLAMFGFRPLTPPLHYAARQGDLPEVQRLVEGGVDIEKKDIFGKKPLELAFDEWINRSEGDQPGVVYYLISQGAEVTQDSLEAAILVEDLQLVKVIISRGVPLQPDSLAQYVMFTRERDTNFMEYLLSNGADINSLHADVDDVEYTALSYAVHIRDFPLVQFLVEKGADVNSPVNTLSLANSEYRVNLDDGTGPGVHYYRIVPPSPEIAAYLWDHGAR